jgi:palmitoyltransferase ZDHHC13/17
MHVCLRSLLFNLGLVDVGIILVFSSVEISTNPADISPSCPLPSDLCAITHYDPFLFSVAIWSTLQLSWTIVLLGSQLWQIARQMTTLEVSNLGRYGFMGGRGGTSLNAQMGHQHQNQHHRAGSADDSDSQTPHAHRHTGGSVSGFLCCGSGGFLMNLLGFDRFTRGKAVDGLARAGSAVNPFDLGLVGNCKDFWSAGRELGVEYERLYDVPLEGFSEAKRKRMLEEEEDGHHLSGVGNGRKGGLRKSLLMGFGLSRGGASSRAGYEPVSQV